MNLKTFIKVFFKNQLITFIDIGAADTINKRWKKISKNLNFIGFEPNYEEYIKIKNKEYGKFNLFNFALGEYNGKKTLNILESEYASSFLTPNYNVLREFSNLKRFKIKKKVNLKVKTIDSLNLKSADFVKIDTQGYNLKILKGAKKTLKKIIGIEIETEFLSIYKKQDLFEDIKIYLEKNNFNFINFYNLRRWSSKDDFLYGRTIFCNSLFLKKLNYKELRNKKIVIKYILICILYNNLDIAYKTLYECKLNKNEKEDMMNFIKSLNKKNYLTKIYVSAYNRLSRLLNKDNELFPTF